MTSVVLVVDVAPCTRISTKTLATILVVPL